MSRAMRFDVESVRSVAEAHFGLRDVDTSLLGEPLTELLAALDQEARIDPLKRATVVVELAHQLAMWGRVNEVFDAHPEIADQPIERPVFVVGLPRTGTTLLHNLLAGHPELRAPRLWEMRAPVHPAGAAEDFDRQSRKETQQLLDRLHDAGPGLSAIHPVTVDGPDECSWLFRSTFATLYFAFRHPIMRYAQWVMATDMTPYYQAYRRMLQAMSWQRPGTGRWVLKDPCHLWHLDALTEVFPDATVVFLHRPLREVLPSMASLFRTLHSMDSLDTDPLTLAAYTTELANRGVYGAMNWRPFIDDAQCVDIDFRQLVEDPASALSTIAEQAGFGIDEAALSSMMRWVRENPRGKSGAHRYTLDDFGFKERAIRARFARYEATYLG